MRFQTRSNKVAIELRVVQFWSDIILVISNRTRATRSFDFEITRMNSDQIAPHWVQYSVNSNHGPRVDNISFLGKNITHSYKQTPKQPLDSLTSKFKFASTDLWLLLMQALIESKSKFSVRSGFCLFVCLFVFSLKYQRDKRTLRFVRFSRLLILVGWFKRLFTIIRSYRLHLKLSHLLFVVYVGTKKFKNTSWPRPNYAGEIWNRSFIFVVWPIVHTRSCTNTEFFENAHQTAGIWTRRL